MNASSPLPPPPEYREEEEEGEASEQQLFSSVMRSMFVNGRSKETAAAREESLAKVEHLFNYRRGEEATKGGRAARRREELFTLPAAAGSALAPFCYLRLDGRCKTPITTNPS